MQALFVLGIHHHSQALASFFIQVVMSSSILLLVVQYRRLLLGVFRSLLFAVRPVVLSPQGYDTDDLFAASGEPQFSFNYFETRKGQRILLLVDMK